MFALDVVSAFDLDPIQEEEAPANAQGLQPPASALSFTFGGITSPKDLIIPRLKDLFAFSHFHGLLTMVRA